MNFNFYKLEFYITFIFVLNLFIIKEGKTQEINNNYIVMPFKSYFPKYDYSTNVNKALINSWIRRKLYLDIENKSGQKLQMILNSNEPKMHTREVVAVIRTDEKYYEPYNRKDSNICTFNYLDSNNYELTTEFKYQFYSIQNTCFAKEKIYIYKDFNLKEKELFDIEFIHSCNETQICFFAGFQITENIADKSINLFHQINNSIHSNSFSWALNFTSPDEGVLIFGDIINNNKLDFYNDNIEDNYISLGVSAYSLDSITWKLMFEKVIFGDYVIKSDSEIYFFMNFQNRYITVPKQYFYDIKNKYLLLNEIDPDTGDMKFICHEEETEFFFHTIYCNKKEYLELTDNYKKLPDLNLFGYRFGINITFTPQDLFIEKGDYVYFYIAYDSHNDEDWNIGTIFEEKYLTVFENYEKRLHFLKKGDKKKDKDEENKENEGDEGNDGDGKNDTFKISIIIILVVIISALIFGYLGIFYGKKIYQIRRKKANELNDDGYDYTTTKDNNIVEPKEKFLIN